MEGPLQRASDEGSRKNWARATPGMLRSFRHNRRKRAPGMCQGTLPRRQADPRLSLADPLAVSRPVMGRAR